MNREAFFARKLPTTTVTLDDGQSVAIRKLTQAEVETCRRSYSSPEKALDGYRYVVSRVVVDAEGRRTFEDADMAKLAEVDHSTISAIAIEALKFSGVLKEDAAKKP